MNPDDPVDVVRAAIAALEKHGQDTQDLLVELESFDVATIVGRWPPKPSEKASPGLNKTDQLFADTLFKLGAIGEHSIISVKLNAFRDQISLIGILPDDFGAPAPAEEFGDDDAASITGRWPPD
ncbi:MAG: hypothetical protein QFC78_11040 [Pseudomonadota bacterium]|nr:hypothetical protein [Pseudomonadota bacterium]